jgi:acetyltransferase-like isoleucine patch superfamily enzyme
MFGWKSHSAGLEDWKQLIGVPSGTIIEDGVRIFLPENVRIAKNVYIGHDSILKAYFDRELVIGEGSWIGPQCFIYAAGGITIGKDVGIGPGVKMISSTHAKIPMADPILKRPIERAPIVLENGCDIGTGSVVLMGVTIGKCAQIGAGSVVNKDVAPYVTAAGNPARII